MRVTRESLPRGAAILKAKEEAAGTAIFYIPRGSQMNIFQKVSILSAVSAALSIPAFAGVTIASPTAGEAVNTSFTLSANAAYCSSQPVGTMGYSFDSSSTTTTVKGSSINQTISASTGKHTVHVKAWGSSGASCVADVVVNVSTNNTTTSTTSSGGPSIPSTAKVVSSMQALKNWKGAHDAGTPGTSSGTMSMASSPAQSGNARKFYTTFSKYGGERYITSFADDVSATNFVYDGWIFLHNTASTVANLEMDVNQVMENGLTVIFGFQCDHWSGTWDYTANLGTPKAPKDKWIHSTAACNTQKWAQNVWHHVQVSYSRDDSGNVTYNAVWLDGVKQVIGAKVNSAFALGWAPTILTNFQVDGALSGSGSSTIYLDNLALYRW
jgi:hypothetical protein